MVPLFSLFIGLIVLAVATVYLKFMYRTEAEAEKYYNPYSVYAIAPFEEVMYRNLWLPLLQSVCNIQNDKKQKDDLQMVIDRFHRWVNLGYIPKEEYPKHLRKFYTTNVKARL